MSLGLPLLGCGIGLRQQHYGALLEGSAPLAAWYEVISENFMLAGGRPLAVLEKVRSQRPIALHGVSLALGSCAPLNRTYLRDLRQLMQRYEPAWVSDHLCWGGNQAHYAHDLWPLPHTEEAVEHTASRLRYVQDTLQCRLLIENIASYVQWQPAPLREWEFLLAVCERADCGILLDINNVYVNARNHGFKAETYLAALPAARIGQIHLAGHADHTTYCLDTHAAPISPAVWQLYQSALQRFGAVSTLIEWDEHLPALEVLLQQAANAQNLLSAAKT